MGYMVDIREISQNCLFVYQDGRDCEKEVVYRLLDNKLRFGGDYCAEHAQKLCGGWFATKKRDWGHMIEVVMLSDGCNLYDHAEGICEDEVAYHCLDRDLRYGGDYCDRHAKRLAWEGYCGRPVLEVGAVGEVDAAPAAV